jgi:putative two-component system response regulator
MTSHALSSTERPPRRSRPSLVVSELEAPREWVPRLLIADDVSHNIELLKRILGRAGYSDYLTTTDGPTVLAEFTAGQPDIVLLDLHMPNTNGIEIIEQIRAASANSVWVPVIVLTGDSSPAARRSCLSAGASDFIGKPYDMAEVTLRVHNLLETRRLHLALVADNDSLEARVLERTQQLAAAQLEVLQRLAIATEKRDDDTGEHTRRVGVLAGDLAERLGLGSGVAELLRTAAPLHDIGKIAIPDAILNKPGRLTPDEYEVMKTHAANGAAILTGGDHELIVAAERIAATHHEHWDGRGYPLGLSGTAIPIEGRITAVADFYDALTHARVYRPAFSHATVIGMVEAGAGSQFDPEVVAALLSIGDLHAPS